MRCGLRLNLLHLLRNSFVIFLAISSNARAVPVDDHEECKQRIVALEERLTLLEETLKTVLSAKAKESPVEAATTFAPPVSGMGPIHEKPGYSMPAELIPEVGHIGAEVGILLNASRNPFGLNSGSDVAGFIDLPLMDRPTWLHGKLSYEISIGITRSKTKFATTSNVAQVANLTVLNAIAPNGGIQNVLDSLNGTGSAPFPVTQQTTTTMKMLQVVPFSFKYTSNLLDRYRVRPYGLVGFGTYVTIHEQSPTSSGVRTDANLPPAVLTLVNRYFGGQAPFGGPLVAGQLAQSPELQARGLPSGHGNFDLGWVTGGGVEFRLQPRFSLGFDGRWNRIAGTPGSLQTFGARLGFHF